MVVGTKAKNLCEENSLKVVNIKNIVTIELEEVKTVNEAKLEEWQFVSNLMIDICQLIRGASLQQTW